ncbi:prepilin peptidase [Paractinoplanes brasiliensis]|uniref:prepilin peptidase n=1 Tax=Paractinoplanes brasiliensis TaxID=52695 RepID=UPI001A3A048A|nr:prepilin peptidase [Actinoplanes brasiliensis]GID29100.1 prepilin peptidase [Actinoplanes brasiliensis]
MSSPLVICAAVFGASVGALLPRAARRFPTRVSPYAAFIPVVASASTGAIVCVLLAGALGPSPMLPFYLLATIPGLLLALVDLRCLRLPDPLVAVFAALTVVPLAASQPQRIMPALAAGAVVVTAYLGIALLPGRGLGLGDVKLAGVIATILGFAGWEAVLVGVVVPHLIAGPVALVMLLARRGRPLPFGPALLVGALIGVVTAA